eukprot:TRINITY_DN9181_c1_g2_i1.p2 TRINITY_DN9181_c1_g2~~TRINITY_DN9181_c1_g2_i1.p2  ORF type:complete len:216 (-),score=17.66 TRINITY_DN9181_c1_g2_i1:217-864(-)
MQSKLDWEVLASKLVDSKGSIYKCRKIYYRSNIKPKSLKSVKMRKHSFLTQTQQAKFEEKYRCSLQKMQQIEQYLSYDFKDKQLLVAALGSTVNDCEVDSFQNNELAWLGDAVLELLVVLVLEGIKLNLIYYHDPLNIQCLSSKKLAKFSKYMKINEAFQHKYPDDRTLAETLEALVGAMYVDGGGMLYGVGNWFYTNWPFKIISVSEYFDKDFF